MFTVPSYTTITDPELAGNVPLRLAVPPAEVTFHSFTSPVAALTLPPKSTWVLARLELTEAVLVIAFGK